MIYNLGVLRRQFMGIDLKEGDFKTRKTKEGSPIQRRLEIVSKTFINGFNMAIEYGNSTHLLDIIASLNDDLKGFFYEGAAGGLYTLDKFSLTKKNRLWDFAEGPASEYESIMYAGIGVCMGAINAPFEKFLERAEPLRGVMCIDGIGFFHAYFKKKSYFNTKTYPKTVRKNEFYRQRFDNGVGRAHWFKYGPDVQTIANQFATYPEDRHPALWAGLGMAAAYAGFGKDPDLDKYRLLKKLAGKYAIKVAQGACLAIHYKELHNPHDPYKNDEVAKILTGKTQEECHIYIRAIIDTFKDYPSHIHEGRFLWDILLEKAMA